MMKNKIIVSGLTILNITSLLAIFKQRTVNKKEPCKQNGLKNILLMSFLNNDVLLKNIEVTYNSRKEKSFNILDSVNHPKLIFRFSGETWSKGFRTPCRTWYKPKYSFVFSKAITSLGSSTTQIVDLSLLGEEQIEQGSLSV